MSRKREHRKSSESFDGDDTAAERGGRLGNSTVNEKVLEALQTQNELLKSINAKLDTQNELLKQNFSLGRGEDRQRRQRVPINDRRGPVALQAVKGTWRFRESDCATRKRDFAIRKRDSAKTTSMCGSGHSHCPLYGRIIDAGSSMVGEVFPRGVYTNTGQKPDWSTSQLRYLLPEVVFEGESKLKMKTGIYSLTIKYSCGEAITTKFVSKAAIIVGEIEFNNEGYVLAEGADWDRLLNDQRQTQLSYSNNARGVPTWLPRKVSEPWQNNDELKFLIDTNENTIVYQRNDMPKKTFWNVLAFTNNRNFPEFLRVFAFCRGALLTVRNDQLGSSDEEDVKLTIS